MPQFDSCRSTDGRCSVGSPNAAVFLKLGQTPSTSAQNDCCLSLLGALSPCPTVNAAFARAYLPHCPLHPAFTKVPLCCSSGVLHSTTCGIDPLSLFYFRVQALFQTHAALSPLLLVLPPFPWTLASAGPHQIVCGRSCWAYDSFPGGRAARHPGLSLSYTLGEASSGYFFSCLLECLALSTVVSCVLPNSTLHSARLIPRPYLVCWTGLRALCLAVTISSRFPGSLFPRQEGEDCRNFFSGRTPSLQRTGRVVTPPNARTTNSAKSAATVAAVDAARCCWCRCCGRNRNNADGYSRGGL